MSRNLARMGSQLRSQATENCLLLMIPPLLYAELHAEGALFAGRQALHFVFGFRRRRSVGIFDACQQPARRMRARIASTLAARMHGITRRHIDGDPGVDAAIFAFNQVQEPCHFLRLPLCRQTIAAPMEHMSNAQSQRNRFFPDAHDHCSRQLVMPPLLLAVERHPDKTKTERNGR